MQIKTLVLLLFAITFLSTNLQAQIDTTRKHEIRLSYFGSVPFSSSQFDERLRTFERKNNASLSYLRRVKESKYFLVGSLGAGGFRDSYFSDITIVGEGQSNFGSIYFGVEKQKQFNQIGIFLGAGIKGGMINYRGDFQFIDSQPIKNFEFQSRSIGISARATFLTNITDNLYIFLTTSANISHITNNYTNAINDKCCDDSIVFDSHFFFLDAIGISYKLPSK